MKIEKVGVFSLAKVQAILAAFIGLIIGTFYTILSILINSWSIPIIVSEQDKMIIRTLGAMEIIIFPIIYGVVGFISGAVIAFLYNLIAKWVGGIEIELESKKIEKK